MKGILSRLWVPVIVMVLLTQQVQAQTAHFIYIQTENKQPFYVRMDKRVLSSSSLGYMIIANLTSNNYPMVIGFPNSLSPELNVNVEVNNANAGFLLKNYGPGGWGMVNLQTAQLLVMQEAPLPPPEPGVKIDGDEFARILAEVVNDSNIAKVTVLPTVSPVKPIQNNATSPDQGIVTGHDSLSTANLNTLPSLTVSKTGSTQTADAVTDIKKPATDEVPVKKPLTNTATSATGSAKNNCKKTATQDDFVKLRKQMTGADGEGNMTKLARKRFISTCFSTLQISSLGELFLNEEEKYKFYVAAYPYVSDIDNFKDLVVQLTDNYYKTRLKAMLGR